MVEWGVYFNDVTLKTKTKGMNAHFVSFNLSIKKKDMEKTGL